MAGANGGWPAPPTLQLASNLLRSISPTASTIRWMMSSSGSHSIMSTGSRKRCRRSGVRKKWAIDPHLGSMAPRESRPPPQRHYLLMPRGHQFAVRYGNRLHRNRQAYMRHKLHRITCLEQPNWRRSERTTSLGYHLYGSYVVLNRVHFERHGFEVRAPHLWWETKRSSIYL